MHQNIMELFFHIALRIRAVLRVYTYLPQHNKMQIYTNIKQNALKIIREYAERPSHSLLSVSF